MPHNKGYVEGYINTPSRTVNENAEFEPAELAGGILPTVTTTVRTNNYVILGSPSTLQIDIVVPGTTTTDGTEIGIIVKTPVGEVLVEVNGISAVLYDGSISVSAAACYFTSPDGATTRNATNVRAGDSLRWNGTSAGYELDSNDEIKIIYAV
jgi:hypothetical protein